ncbi:zinc-binding dehydrogenase [Streptomyces sp. NPDC008313]|uniref:zinc-binding dehydrogenase n=1 Tax=Streptomyces sp. NPDC008313 TaxID=3364826 RepID=UPI0036EEE1D8
MRGRRRRGRDGGVRRRRGLRHLPRRQARAAPGRTATAGRRPEVRADGVDKAFDAALIGAPLLGAVRDGGSFVSAAAAVAPAPERDITVTGVHARPNGAQLTDIIDRVATGELTIRNAEVLPIEHGAQAHRLTEAGGLRGKLVLTS